MRSEPIHGHAHRGHRTPTYNSWRAMVYRCHSPNFHAFKFYGARGVTVCDRWRVFANFLADMGEKPPDHPRFGPYEIDRFETDMEYCRANCQWLPKLVNVWRRNNPTLLDEFGLPAGTITIACPF